MHCTNCDLLCIRQMKATIVSYEVDVNRKLIFQRKHISAIENNKSEKKPRKYNNCYSHAGTGFTFILQNGEEKPLCVVCSRVLASKSILPSKL